MQSVGPIWKRAVDSIKRLMNRPIGVNRWAPAAPRPSPVAAAPTQTPTSARTRPPAAVANSSPPNLDPSSEPPPAPAARKLWGRDFSVTAEGLEEGQVVQFVDSLLGRYEILEKQQRHYFSLGTLSEKAAIEADKAAEAIRQRARGKAEAESARVIAEAHQKSQQMLSEAKAAAREATRPEVESVLAVARRRSALIEEDAKRQAQMFFVKSRELIAEDLEHAVQQASSQLLLCVQKLNAEGHRLEAAWKDKTTEVCRSGTFELQSGDGRSPAFAAEMPASFWSGQGEAAQGEAAQNEPAPAESQAPPPPNGDTADAADAATGQPAGAGGGT